MEINKETIRDIFKVCKDNNKGASCCNCKYDELCDCIYEYIYYNSIKWGIKDDVPDVLHYKCISDYTEEDIKIVQSKIDEIRGYMEGVHSEN